MRKTTSAVLTLTLLAHAAQAQDIHAPPPLPVSGIGWVYDGYVRCTNEACELLYVRVGADGVNVREHPDGHAVGALVNGTILVPLDRVGRWVYVAAGCDLVPTGIWSDTAGVQLAACR